jgi:HD-GYP domain-containing protein (c-di-GMP phosphodiesterase class II)
MAAHVAFAQALSFARDLRAAYDGALLREQELLRANERLGKAHQQALRWALDLRRTKGRLQHAILNSLFGLSTALEGRTACMHAHGARVARLARRLALHAGLPRMAAETIANAGLLHDLGLIALSEQILSKPGPLTGSEWDIVRGHPLTGAQILAPLEFFADGAVIVLHHHERQDGSGYPDGLRGDSIPVGARVVAIADVYDALVSDRPYRPRLTPEAAIEHLREEAGRRLDTRLTALFIELLEGDALGLDTGDREPGRPGLSDGAAADAV